MYNLEIDILYNFLNNSSLYFNNLNKQINIINKLININKKLYNKLDITKKKKNY
jgi:hypothetical protein